MAEINPNSSSVRGGDVISVSGSNFQSGQDYLVTFDGIASPNVEVISSTELKVTVPEGTYAGDVDVSLVQGTRVLSQIPKGFKYSGSLPPAISQVVPFFTSIEGGEKLTIIGSNFKDTAEVRAGTNVVSSTWIDSNTLEIIAPAGLPNTTVTVEITQDEDVVQLENAFGYYRQPEGTSVLPSSGSLAGGEQVEIYGVGFTAATAVYFGDRAATSVQFVNAGKLIAYTPSYPTAGPVGVYVINDPSGATPWFNEVPFGKYTYTNIPKEAPYVVSAFAASATEVRVQFSQPMNPETFLLNAFNISASDGNGYLQIKSVTAGAQNLAVLETYPMSEMEYSVVVTGVLDVAGQALRPKGIGGVDYTRANFFGAGETAPSGEGQQDSDGDGVSDAEEQRGYLVTYQKLNGSEVSLWATSALDKIDTDGDGISDAEERLEGTNPRVADTDGDALSDRQEMHDFQSDATDQDTDDDGLDDDGEVNGTFTSPLLADTDGDQFTDWEELFARYTNPRIADLPMPAINISSFSSALDVRYVSVTSTGSQNTNTQTFETSASTTEQNDMSFGIGLNAFLEGGYGEGGAIAESGPFFKTGVSGQFSWATNITTIDTSNMANGSSSEQGSSQETTISREVVGGRITAAVDFSALSPVAFTITDVELSVMMRDPADPEKFKPVATLLPSNPAMEINIGPMTGSRGPVIFNAVSPIPEDVEALMKNPNAFVVRIANYNLVDENRRNFAYAGAEVYQRTAGFNIVYNNGNEVPETYRAGTSGMFSPDGQPVGMSLTDMLSAIGLTQVDDANETIATLEIREHTYSGTVENQTVSGEYYVNNTFSVTNGVITRVRNTQIAMVACAPADGLGRVFCTPEGYDLWILLDDAGVKVDATALDSTYLKTQRTYTLVFSRDTDGDGISAAEETVVGTKDNLCDSDGDGVSDYRELRGLAIPYLTTATNSPRASLPLCPSDPALLADIEPLAWRIAIYGTASGGQPSSQLQNYRAYSNPSMVDSDNDGMNDAQEFSQKTTVSGNVIWVTDPLSADTDADGLSDDDEINGYQYVDLNNATQSSAPATLPSNPRANVVDSDGDSLDDGVEYAVGTNPDVQDADSFADANRDGLSDKLSMGLVAGSTVWYDRCASTAFTNVMLFDSASPSVAAAKTSADLTGQLDGVAISLGYLVAFSAAPQNVYMVLGSSGNWSFLNIFSIPVGTSVKVLQGSSAGQLLLNNGIAWLQDPHGYYLTDSELTALRTDGIAAQKPGDVDGDGLPNVWEYYLCSNPARADTDSDGLTDYNEWKGSQPSGASAPAARPQLAVSALFSSTSYAQASSLCARSVNCQLDLSDSLKYGTLPNLADSDGDTLSDKAELVDGWSVWLKEYTQAGRVAPFKVYSNPLVADTDNDGISDAVEKTYTTNPLLADTDGDGVNDKVEIDPRTVRRVVAGQFARQVFTNVPSDRDPLEKDIAFTVRLTNLVILETFGSSPLMDFRNFNLILPNRTVTNLLTNHRIQRAMKNWAPLNDPSGNRFTTWTNCFMSYGDWNSTTTPSPNVKTNISSAGDSFAFGNNPNPVKIVIALPPAQTILSNDDEIELTTSDRVVMPVTAKGYISSDLGFESNSDSQCDSGNPIYQARIINAGIGTSESEISADVLVKQGFQDVIITEKSGTKVGGSDNHKFVMKFSLNVLPD